MSVQTFILGPGVLITPNGQEYKVTEFTITREEGEVIKEGEHIIHIGPPKIPCRIEFRNTEDAEED